MDKATFDLLDAPLSDAYGHYQDLNDEDRFNHYRQTFLIDPKNWTRHIPPEWVFELHWQEYRYAEIQRREDLNRIITGDTPGIYIFYTRANSLVYRFPQFAFYIGISNERESHRPLRDRLSEYLPTSLNSIKKRKNVHRMLRLYYNHIWVAFALSSASSEQLSEAEKQLHGFIYPCFNRRDFPTDIKQQQQAFGVI